MGLNPQQFKDKMFKAFIRRMNKEHEIQIRAMVQCLASRYGFNVSEAITLLDKEQTQIASKSTLPENLCQRIAWATTKPDKLIRKPEKTIGVQKKEAERKEKEWGNSMIGQKNNGQWTTLLGERLVYDVLELRGEHPKKVERKGGFEPDWECDDYIYEVKTSNWWVTGTAGEKVLGTWIKYQEIKELYGKPLRIICVANQEYELEYGKIKYFGKNVTCKTEQALALAKSWGIEYMRFSDLISPLQL